jgi:hypothetical protein
MIHGDPTCGNEESGGKNVKKEEMEGKWWRNQKKQTLNQLGKKSYIEYQVKNKKVYIK